jgi:hypothetical protein
LFQGRRDVHSWSPDFVSIHNNKTRVKCQTAAFARLIPATPLLFNKGTPLYLIFYCTASNSTVRMPFSNFSPRLR